MSYDYDGGYSADVGEGGSAGAKKKNVFKNLIVDVLKKTDKKNSISYQAKFAKIKEAEANTTLIMFQNVLKKIFSSINPDMIFNSFYSLEEYIKKIDVCSYNTVDKFINTIDFQFDMLSVINKCVLSFSPKDIWIINDKFFVFIGNNRLDNLGLVEFDKKNHITTPLLRLNLPNDIFTAPELLSIDEEVIHRNVCNFSLGKIILVMLFGKSADKKLTYEKMKNSLNPIINTKIYYYVLRCIDPDIEMRTNLYV